MSAAAATAGSGGLVERAIDLKLAIATGVDGQGLPDTYTYSGLQVSAAIDMAGNLTPPAAQITVFGLPFDDLNKLSTLGLASGRLRNNVVTMLAGSVGGIMSQAFAGSITDSYATFDGPNSGFQITSLTGGITQLMYLPAMSFSGSVDAALLLKNIATATGYNFENSGVSVQIRDHYSAGTAYDQATAIAEAADINMMMDQNTLAIWPKNGSRDTPSPPLISPDTG